MATSREAMLELDEDIRRTSYMFKRVVPEVPPKRSLNEVGRRTEWGI